MSPVKILTKLLSNFSNSGILTFFVLTGLESKLEKSEVATILVGAADADAVERGDVALTGAADVRAYARNVSAYWDAAPPESGVGSPGGAEDAFAARLRAYLA